MITPKFSPKENEVIKCLRAGQSNKQIAQSLGVSVRTVEFHLSNIYARLDTRSRTEAVIKLTELNLRESTGENTGQVLRKSTVVKKTQGVENGKTQIKRRFPMKNLLIGIIAGVVLTLAIVFVVSTMDILRSNLISKATTTETFTPFISQGPAVTEAFTPYMTEAGVSTSEAETAAAFDETHWAPTSLYYTQAAASGIYPLAFTDTPTPLITNLLTLTPLPTYGPTQKP